MTQTTPPGRNPAVWVAVSILLIIGIAGTLWVPIYARTTPKLGDFPFFYWYQLIWVPVVAILSLLCLPAAANGRRAGRSSGARTAGGRRSDSRQRGRVHDRHRLVRDRHRGRVRRGPVAPGART